MMSHDKSAIIKLWHINNQDVNTRVQNVNGATGLLLGEDDRAIYIPAAIKMRHGKIYNLI